MGTTNKPASDVEQAPAPAAAKSIFDTIPIPLVLFLASPYLAGETAQQAIGLAQKLYRENKFSSTLDILGEDMSNDEDCDASVGQYKQLIDAISKNPLPVNETRRQPTVSFKPSMFATSTPASNYKDVPRSADLDKAYHRIESVVEYASLCNVNVTLEAEDHRWADFQLDTYHALIEAGYRNVGTVLQTRLFRTEQDIKRFDDRMRTRIVIGIYNEPATVAHTQKPVMKELLVKYARELIARGTYVEVATHDTECLTNFFNNVVIPDKVPNTAFETQYLHGVPRKRFQKSLITGEFFSKNKNYDAAYEKQMLELANKGVLVRMYLPYGEGKVAGAYCRRRLKENPNMAIYGIKNLLGIDS
ncbi:MAG: proline dehydrogenase family protein [Cyanobacteria bacterium SZAS TMP-1]|nr:proline dehydrogenase family protein [Cyanobacteria bacterium SZAS TMP-1]